MRECDKIRVFKSNRYPAQCPFLPPACRFSVYYKACMSSSNDFIMCRQLGKKQRGEDVSLLCRHSLCGFVLTRKLRSQSDRFGPGQAHASCEGTLVLLQVQAFSLLIKVKDAVVTIEEPVAGDAHPQEARVRHDEYEFLWPLAQGLEAELSASEDVTPSMGVAASSGRRLVGPYRVDVAEIDAGKVARQRRDGASCVAGLVRVL